MYSKIILNIDNYYLWFKSLHLFMVIAWMAGLLYLPRIYAYHAGVAINSEADKIFQTMEYRLLRVIMNPAMIGVYIFGFITAYIYGFAALGIWFHIKIAAVLILTIMHMLFAKYRKDFANGCNKHSVKFYRIINEIPTILMLVIIVMVIIKPFE